MHVLWWFVGDWFRCPDQPTMIAMAMTMRETRPRGAVIEHDADPRGSRRDHTTFQLSLDTPDTGYMCRLYIAWIIRAHALARPQATSRTVVYLCYIESCAHCPIQYSVILKRRSTTHTAGVLLRDWRGGSIYVMRVDAMRTRTACSGCEDARTAAAA